MKTYELQNTDVRTLSDEELKIEIDTITSIKSDEYKNYPAFSILNRTEELNDEYKYRKYYKDRGYTRFEAGYDMEMRGW